MVFDALVVADLGSNREVTEFLIAGGRHRQPDLCPDDLYQVMHNCWHKDPVRRPTFEAIYNQIDSPDGAQYVTQWVAQPDGTNLTGPMNFAV